MTRQGDPLELTKAALRERIAIGRRALPDERRSRAGSAIAGRLVRVPEFARAGTVGLFAALPDEPDTRPLFDQLRARGAAVHFPRCAAGRTLEWCRVDTWEDLCPGRYGVREPAPGLESTPNTWMELVLVPGVAFDRAGRRLGRGGGYYDRSFADSRGGPVLFGVAFAFQLVDEVPVGRLDRRVDAIVTEEAIIRVMGPDRGAGRGGAFQ